MAPRARVLIVLLTADDVARHWREYLQNGGAFCAGETPADDDVTLVLMREGEADLELAARAVYRAEHGTGYELEDWNAELRRRLQAWTETEEVDEPEAPRPELAKNLQQRLRNLPVHQQSKLARDGDLRERIALERLYGKPLWESLLRNPRITPPEVARIARMGTLPLPLLELIVGNGGWLRAPEVRRALLANLKLSADMIPRILRMLPKHELKLVPTQTAYPMAVREVARRMLREV